MKKSAAIIGTGLYVPENKITNADLEALVDTNDEWITSRTGISERRVAAAGQATSDLAYEAAKGAIAAAGIKSTDLDMIVIGTITPDRVFPSTACLVQEKLGAGQIPAFDISAACSGFLYALEIARQVVQSGSQRYVLAMGAETLTRITDYQDRGSCILFGDGAGAAVVGNNPDQETGIIDCLMGADGRYADLLQLPAGGSRLPASIETVESRQHYMKIKGRAVYKMAVTHIIDVIRKLLAKNKLAPENIDLYIPHQMNVRIMEAAAVRLGISMDKVFVNIERYGNTSAASVPIALAEACRLGVIKPGMNIVMVAFGGGLTWAATLLKWQG